MAIEIRRARSDDVDAIAACLRDLGYDTGTDAVARKLALFAASPGNAVFVAVVRVGIVGVVSVHLLPLFHAPGNLGRVTALVVLEGHRGKGVGRALMSAAEQYAWQHDCRRIEITSGDHRKDAHAFYRKLGYETDERRFIKHARVVR